MAEQPRQPARRGPPEQRGRKARRTRRTRTILLAAAAVAVAAVVAIGALLALEAGPATPSRSASGPEGLALAGVHPITGAEVTLAEFEGKPVVVNIWASWCPGCYAEAEALARFAEAHPEAGVIGINFQDTRQGARSFYQRYGWKFPSISDPQGKIAARLRLQGMPTTIFLNADHREVARIVGETDEPGFANGLKQATGEA